MTRPETDWLTGLRSHWAFLKALEAAAQQGEPYALLMLDVDRLAWYNHDFHHDAADDVLRSLAGILLHHARPADLVARYGGDEFVVMLPQTTLNEAEVIAEQVRADVAGFPWPNRPLTVGIGVAALEVDLKTWQDVVVASEEALHDAKMAGGNCVRVAR